MHKNRASLGVEPRRRRQVPPRWFGALVLCSLAATAGAKDPPLDPWADPQWRTALAGLKAADVRTVRWSEQLFDGADAAATSQVRRFEFGDDGRLASLDSVRSRRGERDEHRQLHYRWSTPGTLQRIDEDGATQPLLQRQLDANGRLVLQVERRGDTLERTSVLYDAAGRERERVIEAGSAGGRTRERRSYHPNGALKSLDTDTKGGPARTVAFDPFGR